MNYLGNKYKLLDQMIPLFPKNISTFYDVFCGGLDVSLNVKANRVIANDKHGDLIWLYEEIKKYNTTSLGCEIKKLDDFYFPMNNYKGKAINTWHRTGHKDIWNKLMNEKRNIYYKLRDEFNNGHFDFKIILLLMLNTYGIIEFRVKDKYVTFACGNSRVNDNLSKNLTKFKEMLANITFENKDFRDILTYNFNDDDFIYLDPPYYGTSQYKIKWLDKDEQDLYKLLDNLNSKKIKFALSNFVDNANHNNDYLSKWKDKYNVIYLDDDHYKLTGIRENHKSKERIEILITNY